MSLSINQIVNVSLEQSSQGATKRDLSVIALFTVVMCDEFKNIHCRHVMVS